MSKRGWERAWPAALLALLTVAVFWRVVFAGEGLSADGSLFKRQPWSETALAEQLPPANELMSDQYAFFNANEEFISRWVRRGVWPLWNPDLAHGLPSVASIQNAEYFPTNLLLWPVPPFWSRGIRAMLRIGLCMLGTFGFARAVGIGRAGATLAAMSFAFCGFNVVWLSHPPTNVSFLLPLILWTLERTLQTGAFRWGAGLVLSAGAVLLGGHTPTVFHIMVPIAIWLVYRSIASGSPVPRIGLGRLSWRLALCAVTAGLIGAAALLPWFEYLPQNPSDKAAVRLLRTLDWQTLATWVVPDFFGNPAGHGDWLSTVFRVPGWNNYAERTGFVGVAGLLLAVGALTCRGQWKRTLPWALGLFVSVVLIYDPPLLGPLARDLPGFRMANNSKMLSVACFCAAMLGGIGFGRLLEGREHPLRALAGWAFACAAAVWLLTAAWPTAAAWERVGIAGRAEFHRDVWWAVVPALAVPAALVLVRLRRAHVAVALLLAVCAVDLWRFALEFNPTIPTRFAAPATGGIRYLQSHAGNARVLPLGRALMPGNTLLRYGLADVRGGDWVNVHHYEFLLTGRTGHYDFGAYLKGVPAALRALNVSHIVVPRGVGVPAAAELVYDDELRIVKVPGLPRAFLASAARLVDSEAEALKLIVQRQVDLRRTVLLHREEATALAPTAGVGALTGGGVRITRATPNEVALYVDAPARSYLVLVDTWFPGWTCEVDGKQAPILRANVAFRAVALEAGAHDVLFRYRPWTARVGLLLSAGGLLGLAGVGIALRRRSGK